MTHAENPFEDMLADVNVVSACLSGRTEITDAVLDGVWRWFGDVELIVPLPVMPLDGDERDRFAAQIVADMKTALAGASEKWDASGGGDDVENVAATEVAALNGLWRELAGCYAPLVNAQIPKIDMDEQQEADFYSSFVARAAASLDASEDEIRDALRTDSSFRMMIRLQGFDPDRAR